MQDNSRQTRHGESKDQASLMDALAAQFCKVELTFLSASPSASSSTSRHRRQQSTQQPQSSSPCCSVGPVFVRDVANLLLWTVPSPVPLIDSPRPFFVKNRSRVRDVVVIYINRWSYDAMMGTGVRLPPSRERAPNRDTQCAGAGTAGLVSLSMAHPTGPTHDEAEASDAPERALVDSAAQRPWNRRICQAMLAPIRTNHCWARVCESAQIGSNTPHLPNSNSGSHPAGGVQYRPLLCRNPGSRPWGSAHVLDGRPHPRTSSRSAQESDEGRTDGGEVDALLRELFWRNERPRVPGTGRCHNNNSSNSDSHGCNTSDDKNRTADMDSNHNKDYSQANRERDSHACGANASCTSRGVGGLFRQARVIHRTVTSPGDSAQPSEPACHRANDLRVDKGGAHGDSRHNTLAATRAASMEDGTGALNGGGTQTADTTTVDSVLASMPTREDWQRVWRDRALLQRYALHYPEHADVLQLLGFILPPPPDRSGDVHSLSAHTAAAAETTRLPRGGATEQHGVAREACAGWRWIGGGVSHEHAHRPLGDGGSSDEGCENAGSISLKRSRGDAHGCAQNVCPNEGHNLHAIGSKESGNSRYGDTITDDTCFCSDDKAVGKPGNMQRWDANHDGHQVITNDIASAGIGQAESDMGTAADSAPSLRVYAFDCEMVQVASQRSALARGTLVNLLTGEVVLDLLVQPGETIVDYRTRYSGLDAETLSGVTRSLADFQDAFLHHVHDQTFLVGHSLENDLLACQLYPGCFIVDTTWLFPHPAGLPCKNALRYLATRYLRQSIQCGSHDSVEDAWASAALAHLKMMRGPAFAAQSPSVSLLELMGAANTNTNAHASVQVDIRLFDEAANLQYMLPRPARGSNDGRTRNDDTRASTHSEAKDRQTNGHADHDTDPKNQVCIDDVNNSSSSSRVDAVPVRHDEDAVRKVVRALHRDDTTKASLLPSHDVARYRFTWVQFHETAVDVEHRYVDDSGASLARSIDEGSAPSAAPSSSVLSSSFSTARQAKDAKPWEYEMSEKERAYEASQLKRVAAVNDRVMRVVEACADDTIVLVLAADCRDDARTRWGNFYAQAQGVCFGFVKDCHARGPVREMGEGEGCGNDGGGAGENVPAVRPDAVREDTPPACQHQ